LIIDLARRFKHIVTVEENVLNGGFGSSVVKLLQESGITGVTVKNIGIADEFVEHGTQAILRSKYALDAAGIAGKITDLLSTTEITLPLKMDDKAKTG